MPVPKSLDAIVARVGDDKRPETKPAKDGHWALKLPFTVTSVRSNRAVKLPVGLRSQRAGMGAVGIEGLDSMVARVGDDKISKEVYTRGGRRRKPELPRAVAFRAEREGMSAVEIEHLDAMVARVGDDEPTIPLVDRNGRRGPELPRAVAFRAEHEQERAVGAEHLDAMVARVGDDERAVLKQGNALGRPELAGAVAGGIVADGRHGLGMGSIRHSGRQERRQCRHGNGGGRKRQGRPAGAGHADGGPTACL